MFFFLPYLEVSAVKLFLYAFWRAKNRSSMSGEVLTVCNCCNVTGEQELTEVIQCNYKQIKYSVSLKKNKKKQQF